MFGLNPWVILALVIAFLGFGAVGYGKGRADANASWKVAIAGQKAEADKTLHAEKDKAFAKERALVAHSTKLETENADQKAYISGIRLAHGRLLTATCGLYDKNGRRREGGGGASGADSTAAGVTPETAPLACLLPGPIVDALRDLAADADQSEADAATGHDYAVGLAPIFNGTPP